MKIYRFFTVLTLVALMCVTGKAQDDLRHEIGISYGVEPNSIWIDSFTDIVPVREGQTTDNKKWFGSLGVEYFYHTSPLVGVGGIFTTSISTEDILSKNQLAVHRSKSFFSLMPAVKFNWLRRNHWGLYSKAAVGTIFTRFADKDYDENGKRSNKSDVITDWSFNWQVSLIGIEGGGEHVRGFLELGIGEQGVAIAGVRCKFWIDNVPISCWLINAVCVVYFQKK